MAIYRRRFYVGDAVFVLVFEAPTLEAATPVSERLIKEKYPSAKIDPPPEHMPLPYFTSDGIKISSN